MKNIKFLAKVGLVSCSAIALVCFDAKAAGNAKFSENLSNKKFEYSYITARDGDNVKSLAERYDVQPESIVKWNGIKSSRLKAGQRLKIKNATFYHVKGNETINDIAVKYNSSPKELANLNHLKISDKLYKGDRIRIPDSSVNFDKLADVGKKKSEDKKFASSKIQEKISNKKVAMITSKKEVKKKYQLVKLDGKAEKLKPKSFTSKNQLASLNNKTLQKKVAKVNVEKKTALVEKKASKSKKIELAKNLEKKNGLVNASLKTKESKTGKRKMLEGAEYAVFNIKEKPGRFMSPISYSKKPEVLSAYGTKRSGIVNDGINVAAPVGSPVRAAASGEVIYVGNHLKGYGNLVLIKHAGNYFSAYAQLGDSKVKKGQRVKIGQQIGSVGASGNVSRPQLHFAIRKGRNAINPSKIFSKS